MINHPHVVNNKGERNMFPCNLYDELRINGLRIQRDMPVTYLSQWFKVERIEEESEIEAMYENNYKELAVITEIIALQVSYYLARRITHSCGSNSDSLRNMIIQKKKEYLDKFGKEFVDHNKDVDY